MSTPDGCDRLIAYVTGEVKSGKSSLANALAGGFVSGVSILRETFNPSWFQFSKNGKEENIRKISEQLEAIHEENQKWRARMTDQNNLLKEEEVASFRKVTDDQNELPVRYDLEPFNLIDGPGLNDAQDASQQMFFNAMKNRIHQVDLVIFVTEAVSAFTKTSEVNEFREIQALLKQENDSGHFVDLIIVVSKFDSVGHRDYESIFNGIFEKAQIDAKKIFRFSAHKMLIDNVLRNDLSLYVPQSYIDYDMEKILTTCKVRRSPAIRESLNSDHLLRFSDIFIEQDLLRDAANEQGGEPGEVDIAAASKEQSLKRLKTDSYYELINFIRDFQAILPKHRIEVSETYLKGQWTELKRKCMIGEFPTEELQKVMKKFYLFEDLDARKSYQDILRAEMADLGKSHKAVYSVDSPSKTVLEEVLLMLLSFVREVTERIHAHSGHAPIVMHILNHPDDFSIDIHHAFAQLFFVAPKHEVFALKWDDSCCTWLRRFGADRETFSRNDWRVFPDPRARHATYVTAIDKNPLGGAPNPVVHNLLNTTHVPDEVRLLLKLALSPLIYLQERDLSQKLPYRLFEQLCPGMIVSLRMLMTQLTLGERSTPLLNKLFSLNTEFKDILDPHQTFLKELSNLNFSQHLN